MPSDIRKALFRTILALAISILPNAYADQRDPRLGPLFEQLQQATNAQTARSAEREIWSIWHDTPDEESLQIMRQARGALEGNDFPTAINYLNQLVEHAPDYAEAWNQRAIVLYLANDYPGALRDIEQAIRLEPRHFGAYSGRGQVYFHLEELELAAESFEQALAINPWMANIRQQLDMIRSILGSKPQAI